MEEEISLRELIEVIWSSKWLLVGITLVAVLIAGTCSFFMLPKKYEARATIILDSKFMEEQGLSLEVYRELILTPARRDYVFDELNLEEKNYTRTAFQKSVRTEIAKEANLVSITTTGTDPELIQRAVNLLGEISVSDFRQRLIHDKEREITKTEQMLEDINKTLANTPELLGIKEIDTSQSQVILIPSVNPLYEKLSTRWEEINSTLTLLLAEKDYMEEGLQSGGKGLFIILQHAPRPEEAISPRPLLNIAIAGVLGLMAGVFLAFFLEYWRQSTPEK